MKKKVTIQMIKKISMLIIKCKLPTKMNKYKKMKFIKIMKI